MRRIYPEVRRISLEWTEIISEGISEEAFCVFESVLSRIEARARELAEVKEK